MRFSEYESLRQGTRPTAQLGLWGYLGGVAYDLTGERGVDPNDQSYAVVLDVKRYWKSELVVDKLPHRLINMLPARAANPAVS